TSAWCRARAPPSSTSTRARSSAWRRWRRPTTELTLMRARRPPPSTRRPARTVRRTSPRRRTRTRSRTRTRRRRARRRRTPSPTRRSPRRRTDQDERTDEGRGEGPPVTQRRPDPRRGQRRPSPRRRPAAVGAPTASPRSRMRALMIGTLIVLSLFAAQLLRIQGFDSDGVASAALAQRTSTEVIPAERGTILDDDGVVLAQSHERRTIVVDQQAVKTYEKEVHGEPKKVGAKGAASDVAKLLDDVDRKELVKK